MGFMDSAKQKLSGLVGKRGDQTDQGIDKAADVADERTGGQHTGGIDAGADKSKDALDGLDGRTDEDLR